MDISSVSSSSSVLDIYGKAVTAGVENAEKLAKIQIEQQMKADQMAMAEEALVDFYA